MGRINYIFYSIGGYFEGLESVYLERGPETKLVREKWPEEPNVIMRPDSFFDEALSDIEGIIENWKDSYYNSKILDGTQWQILLSVHSRDKTKQLIDMAGNLKDVPGTIFSGGSNDYPENFKELEKYMEVLKNGY